MTVTLLANSHNLADSMINFFALQRKHEAHSQVAYNTLKYEPLDMNIT